MRVEKVEAGSNAEKCGFRKGDCLVAVNNIPVRNERQASRLLTGTAGDLLVLVEREMESTDRGSLSTTIKNNANTLQNRPRQVPVLNCLQLLQN